MEKGPPLHISAETALQLDCTVVTSVLKPHLFHPTLMPARRLALVYGYENDDKRSSVSHFLEAERGIHVHHVTLDTYPDAVQREYEVPTVLLLSGVERLLRADAPHDAKTYYARIPLCAQHHVATVVLSGAPPMPLQHPLWAQYAERIFFELPTDEALAHRMTWNVEALNKHFALIPELMGVTFEVDTAALLPHTGNHTLGDVDDFFKRVAYAAVDAAARAPQVVVDAAFLDPLIARRGAGEVRSLAKRDADSEQWPFNQAAGRHHPVFDAKTEPVVPTKRPRLEEEDVFKELGALPEEEEEVN